MSRACFSWFFPCGFWYGILNPVGMKIVWALAHPLLTLFSNRTCTRYASRCAQCIVAATRCSSAPARRISAKRASRSRPDNNVNTFQMTYPLSIPLAPAPQHSLFIVTGMIILQPFSFVTVTVTFFFVLPQALFLFWQLAEKGWMDRGPIVTSRL